MSRNVWIVPLLLASGVAFAGDPQQDKSVARAADAQAQADKDAKELSGMSVLGNQEAPKALVIVPWKSSEIGDSLGISTMLDDSRQPVDKEVFLGRSTTTRSGQTRRVTTARPKKPTPRSPRLRRTGGRHEFYGAVG